MIYKCSYNPITTITTYKDIPLIKLILLYTVSNIHTILINAMMSSHGRSRAESCTYILNLCFEFKIVD